MGIPRYTLYENTKPMDSDHRKRRKIRSKEKEKILRIMIKYPRVSKRDAYPDIQEAVKTTGREH